MNFRQELSLEQVQMRATDLFQTIRIRAGMCQETADAIKAVEAALVPVYDRIRSEHQRREDAARVERERLVNKQ
jgi:hypothetical protein